MSILLYVLLGILALLTICAVGAMIFFKLSMGRRDRWRRPDEKRFGSGEKRALILYQPSNGRHNVPQVEELARSLAGEGYAVTVNHPSDQVEYDPVDFDLLVFGTPVYMGETAKPLHKYLEDHRFSGKRVILFINGLSTDNTADLEALKLRVADGNRIDGVKVTNRETEKLIGFVKSRLEQDVSADPSI